MTPLTSITNWFVSLAKVWRREFMLILKDPGVMLFFFALPLMYPVVYTLIYNPELARDIPVAVVDNCRTAQSRELARQADATQAMSICGYAASIDEARQWMNSKECFGILVIPEDYSRNLGRGEQAVVQFYAEMSLLLRYRGFISSLTDLTIASGAELRPEILEAAGVPVSVSVSAPVNAESHFLGDPEQGFCSFIIPGILILILQQSIVLGVCMLGGGAAERRRRNGGMDPMLIPAPATATALGKALCYLVLYIPLIIFMLHFIPEMFALPHIGSLYDVCMFVLPLIFASAFFGMTLQVFVTERESSMMVIVFTSVVFLFLSGLTWPRYAMNWFWTLIGDCIPATWGVEGFIRINSNGGTLAQNSHPYIMLWVLAGIYFVLASAYWHWLSHRNKAVQTCAVMPKTA